MAYIEVENLKYRYPNTKKLALDGLQFQIEKGSLSELSVRMVPEKVRCVRHSADWYRNFSKALTAEK